MAVIAVETVESFRGERMEREMGFEPTTAALEGRGSSAELLPLADLRPFRCLKSLIALLNGAHQCYRRTL